MFGVAAPSPTIPAGPGGSVDRAIDYLDTVVDQETEALRARAVIDLSEFNNRKNQGLLELNRALRALDAGVPNPSIAARLAGLRAKLDVNRALLKTHLEAVREVASVVADVIKDAESDGTYSPSIRGGARI
jgi:hypothetical protein